MIKTLEIQLKTVERYRTPSGYPKGLVVHYTAGRSLSGASDAKRTLQGLADKGLGCLVMDTDGVIYRAKNQPIDVAAYHAGASEWRGEPRLSLLCMGIEICCAGKLDEKGFSWFGEYYPTELRRASSAKDNIKAGLYHRYTPQQETSLVALCMWAKQVIPGFDFNWVVGHDEIAPKRKSDPGASLSMSMPVFREKLKAEFSKVG